MATISHPAFRILVERFGGCDEYFTEMINAGTLVTGGQFEKYYIDPAPVPQKPAASKSITALFDSMIPESYR